LIRVINRGKKCQEFYLRCKILSLWRQKFNCLSTFYIAFSVNILIGFLFQIPSQLLRHRHTKKTGFQMISLTFLPKNFSIVGLFCILFAVTIILQPICTIFMRHFICPFLHFSRCCCILSKYLKTFAGLTTTLNFATTSASSCSNPNVMIPSLLITRTWSLPPVLQQQQH